MDSAMHWVLTWPRHTLWLAALWAVWAHCEGRFLTKPWGEKLAQGMESAAVGLLLALVAALAGKYFVQSQLPVQAADLGLSPAVVVGVVPRRSLLPSQWWSVRCGCKRVGSATPCSGWCMAQRWWAVHGCPRSAPSPWWPRCRRHRALALARAGPGSAVLAMGSFYYDLQWRLVDKAAVLAGVGMVMALVLWGLRRPTAAALGPLYRTSHAGVDHSGAGPGRRVGIGQHAVGCAARKRRCWPMAKKSLCACSRLIRARSCRAITWRCALPIRRTSTRR